MSHPIEDDLALALDLADRADAIALARFGELDLHVASKPDRTPVTDADTAVETAIRERLAEQRPDDAILGEEYGTVGEGSRQWIIDPIDGTANFLRGHAVWGTLIALAIDGEPVVGVASMPALGRRWWAALGQGAWASDHVHGREEVRELKVSRVASIEDAVLSLPRLNGWSEVDRLDAGVQLHHDAWRVFAASDLWSYCLVAEGTIDATAEFGLQPYDLAALVPIVTEAGGIFTAADGRPGPWHGSGVATNGMLHEALLERINLR